MTENIDSSGPGVDPFPPEGDERTTGPEVTLVQVDTLIKLGTRGWAVVGIVAASVIIYLILAGLSGLVIPLIIATVIGTLFVPLVDKLAAHMPRKLAAGIVLIGLIVVGVGSLVVAVAGVVDQASEIRSQLTSGIATARDWLVGLGVDVGSAQSIADGTENATGVAVSGLSSYVSTVFSSVSALIAGTFVGLFLLFYILADWSEFSVWLGRHIGVPEDLGAGVIDDATWSIRRYFYALTITSLVTAVVIGGTAAVIGVSLAFTIGLITFITSYVPYIGAFVSGAFAVLIALGSSGMEDALIMLAAILVVQMVVQPLLQNRMTSSELDLNPVVSFGSTIVGGVFAGVLGATLSAPVVAMIIKIIGRVRDYRSAGDGIQADLES
jgi:predicted PurR-regulated permease PerM